MSDDSLLERSSGHRDSRAFHVIAARNGRKLLGDRRRGVARCATSRTHSGRRSYFCRSKAETLRDRRRPDLWFCSLARPIANKTRILASAQDKWVGSSMDGLRRKATSGGPYLEMLPLPSKQPENPA